MAMPNNQCANTCTFNQQLKRANASHLQPIADFCSSYCVPPLCLCHEPFPLLGMPFRLSRLLGKLPLFPQGYGSL